jgi:hypothetical protein
MAAVLLFAPLAYAKKHAAPKPAEPPAEPAEPAAEPESASTTETQSDTDAAAPEDAKAEETEKKATPEKADVDATDAKGDDSPVELPGKTYYFVGARYRGIVVPTFMENLFADGGRTVYVNAVGPEFAIRKDGFEYNLGMWLGLYNMDDTAFKGKTDKPQAWELVSSKIDILYLTSDFLWSHEFSPEVSLNYGLGVGLGIVFGDLYRTQSYPTAPKQEPNKYAKCPYPANVPGAPPITPDPIGSATAYCTNDNNHFHGYTEPSWANGGSKPNIFPWLAIQTGIRFKPVKSFVGRLDLGFGTSGFFFGLGADYGL